MGRNANRKSRVRAITTLLGVNHTTALRFLDGERPTWFDLSIAEHRAALDIASPTSLLPSLPVEPRIGRTLRTDPQAFGLLLMATLTRPSPEPGMGESIATWTSGTACFWAVDRHPVEVEPFSRVSVADSHVLRPITLASLAQFDAEVARIVGPNQDQEARSLRSITLEQGRYALEWSEEEMTRALVEGIAASDGQSGTPAHGGTERAGEQREQSLTAGLEVVGAKAPRPVRLSGEFTEIWGDLAMRWHEADVSRMRAWRRLTACSPRCTDPAHALGVAAGTRHVDWFARVPTSRSRPDSLLWQVRRFSSAMREASLTSDLAYDALHDVSDVGGLDAATLDWFADDIARWATPQSESALRTRIAQEIGWMEERAMAGYADPSDLACVDPTTLVRLSVVMRETFAPALARA